MPTNEAADNEITLQEGDMRLKVSPYGASLRGMWRETTDGQREEIVTGYTGAAGKMGGQGDVLIPFPGRIKGGQYTFDGQTYQMDTNDKESPSAIHGFVRTLPWQIAEQSEIAVTFAVAFGADDFPGYPFPLHVTVAYTLYSTGMTCRFAIKNTGEKPAPVAAGFHPYFTVGSETIDNDVLHVPMASTLEFEKLLPTGKTLTVDDTPLDFRTPRPIGSTKLNTCYLHPLRDADGLLRIRLAAASRGRTVTVWMDETFDYVVLYSGDPMPATHARRALAVEPMTCASDGFNHPEWGLIRLAPGATVTGSWGAAIA